MGRKRKILIVAGIVLVITGAWWGIGWYEGYRLEKNWGKVQVGMTKEAVEALLGEPKYKEESVNQSVWVYRILSYRKFYLSTESPFYSDDLLESLEYAVVFSTDNKVAEKCEQWSSRGYYGG